MVNKERIEWLVAEHFKINFGKFSINSDGTVDAQGKVRLNSEPSIRKLPVVFGYVAGDFSCEKNHLQTLQGCPHTVRGHFFCNNNELKSLEGGPEEVGMIFDCRNNQLTSLEGSPRIVKGHFFCHNNPLTSLKGIPDEIGGELGLDYDQQLPLLRCLVATKGVEFDNHGEYHYCEDIAKIINKFAGQGKRGVLNCTKELLTLEKELGIDIRANIRW